MIEHLLFIFNTFIYEKKKFDKMSTMTDLARAYLINAIFDCFGGYLSNSAMNFGFKVLICFLNCLLNIYHTKLCKGNTLMTSSRRSLEANSHHIYADYQIFED